MKAYLTAHGIISPQETHNDQGFPEIICEVFDNRLSCREPDYRDLISPILLRRMPRILKMGLASAKLCINRSAGVHPDAIIVGTGLGCLDNLEKFLTEILKNKEHITSVLPFINSTHNAVAAQIAMLLQNHGYNVTYCHRGMSFESALDDALMHLEEGNARNVLVGGIDECTTDFMQLHGYLHYWKEPLNTLSLANSNSTGTIAGEGSAFFMLSVEPATPNSIAVEGVHTFYTPEGAEIEDIAAEIDTFLKAHQTDRNELGLVLTGINGDSLSDRIYLELGKDYFAKGTGIAFYKHLCGEYYTSTAFALWLGSEILKKQAVPSIVQFKIPEKLNLSKLLIYNHIRNTEHALILLSYGEI
jgi:3-oxoacyl-[acyl-carrier-protein] synthase II